jgi:hypothetical protein
MKFRHSISTLVCTELLTLVAGAPHAMAQACAMCYQNAAASGTQGRSALQYGILILFFPAIGFFGVILLLLYRRRDFTGRGLSLTRSPSQTVVNEN